MTRRRKKKGGYTTLLEQDAQQTLDFINSNLIDNNHYVMIEGFKVRMTSKRYKTFTRQPSCVCCGRTIHTAKLQYTGSQTQVSAHFNFYSEDGKLMTKDHIKPKSKGGSDHMDNLQTMCTICNGKKGDTYNGDS